jgi:formyl-CoA transferase
MPSMAGDGTMQRTLATPLDFGATPVQPPRAPPRLGSDTDAVLRELGVEEGELARLREAKVVA